MHGHMSVYRTCSPQEAFLIIAGSVNKVSARSHLLQVEMRLEFTYHMMGEVCPGVNIIPRVLPTLQF